MDEVGSEDFVLVMERERTLLEAVIDENVALVSDILQKGGHDVNEPDKNGRTLIFWCVNRGNSDLTDVLLQNGADVRIVDIHDNTPLHWCGNIEILHMLIAYGADILAKNKGGLTPRQMAVRRGVPQSVINEYILHEDKFRAHLNRRNVNTKTSEPLSAPTIIQEFCQDIGTRNLCLLLLGLLFISFYVAYTITGVSRHMEYRFPIITDGQNIKL